MELTANTPDRPYEQITPQDVPGRPTLELYPKEEGPTMVPPRKPEDRALYDRGILPRGRSAPYTAGALATAAAELADASAHAADETGAATAVVGEYVATTAADVLDPDRLRAGEARRRAAEVEAADAAATAESGRQFDVYVRNPDQPAGERLSPEPETVADNVFTDNNKILRGVDGGPERNVALRALKAAYSDVSRRLAIAKENLAAIKQEHDNRSMLNDIGGDSERTAPLVEKAKAKVAGLRKTASLYKTASGALDPDSNPEREGEISNNRFVTASSEKEVVFDERGVTRIKNGIQRGMKLLAAQNQSGSGAAGDQPDMSQSPAQRPEGSPPPGDAGSRPPTERPPAPPEGAGGEGDKPEPTYQGLNVTQWHAMGRKVAGLDSPFGPPRDPHLRAIHESLGQLIEDNAKHIVSNDLSDRARGMRFFNNLAENAQEETGGIRRQESPTEHYGRQPYSGEEMRSTLAEVVKDIGGDIADTLRQDHSLPPGSVAAPDQQIQQGASVFETELERRIAGVVVSVGFHAADQSITQGRMMHPEELWGEIRQRLEPKVVGAGGLGGTADERRLALMSVYDKLPYLMQGAAGEHEAALRSMQRDIRNTDIV